MTNAHLNSDDLLRTWEMAAAVPLVWRGVALLAGARGINWEEVAAWPLGYREMALLELRESIFGSEITAHCECPACAQIMEIRCSTQDLRSSVTPPSEPISCECEGILLQLRPLNTNDLAEVAQLRDQSTARKELFKRTVILARRKSDQTDIDKHELDEACYQVAATTLAEADPQADVQLELTCRDCKNVWEVPFDASGYTWTEINSEVRQLLGEVHELAAAYSWSEQAVLALSPKRRAAYLELVRG